MTSRHWRKDRRERDRIIGRIGMGTVIKSVVIDRGHVNGPEIHKVTTTGLIIIYNEYSGKMVTILIARPNQIKRYFENDAPQDVLKIAEYHQRMRYNEL